MSADLKNLVKEAARRNDVCQAVEKLYADVQKEIDLRRPLCFVSGRCCRFDEFGHRLYVTTMELAAFTRNLKATPTENPGGCPFQSGKLCGVHAIRPFGCRIFFCDSTSTEWQQRMYEQFHRRLKMLHEELDVPYVYMEWRQALAALQQ